MRVFIATIVFALLLVAPASARDAAFSLAMSQGGACGLTTERHVFGRSDHMIGSFNPWLARDWRRFPRTSPATGMVAVWNNASHVSMITAVHSNGTVSTTSHNSVRLASITIVDPHGSGDGGTVLRVASHHQQKYAARRTATRHYAAKDRGYRRSAGRIEVASLTTGTWPSISTTADRPVRIAYNQRSR